MKHANRGFTLIEILIAMSVLVVGLVGILALFPVGLNATKKAIEDTNAAMIAESVYGSLRAAAQRTVPGGRLPFFHDGINPSSNLYPLSSSYVFNKTTMLGKTFGIPKFSATEIGSDPNQPVSILDSSAKLNYKVNPATDCCRLGLGKEGTYSGYTYNITLPSTANLAYLKKDRDQLNQYSFNIQLSYPDTNPKNLYDITIWIYRETTLIKKFYTQMMIPTADQ